MKKKILSTYANRFSSKNKRKFREAIVLELEEMGYQVTIDKKFFATNIYFGNIDSEYILTAHYDTATNMAVIYPFLKYFGIRLANLVLPIFLILLMTAFGIIGNLIMLIFGLTLFIALLIPNRYNFNDNTSGVITLLEHAERNKGSNNFYYALLDNEEKGLFGAKSLQKYLKKQGNFSNKCNINVDCVGVGDKFAICSAKESAYLERCFQQSQTVTDSLRLKSLLFASDHLVFGERGIMITKLNKAKLTNDYYIDNIHTNNDRYIINDNIDTTIKIIDSITSK